MMRRIVCHWTEQVILRIRVEYYSPTEYTAVKGQHRREGHTLVQYLGRRRGLNAASAGGKHRVWYRTVEVEPLDSPVVGIRVTPCRADDWSPGGKSRGKPKAVVGGICHVVFTQATWSLREQRFVHRDHHCGNPGDEEQVLEIAAAAAGNHPYTGAGRGAWAWPAGGHPGPYSSTGGENDSIPRHTKPIVMFLTGAGDAFLMEFGMVHGILH